MAASRNIWKKLHQDRTVGLCALACLAGFGGFVAWSAFVPLDEGVAAHGRLAVESRRKVIQHLEGGIVAKLHVREGQKVKAGQVLVELEQVGALAVRDQAGQVLASLQASVDRLDSLTTGTGTIHFTELPGYGIDAGRIAEAQARESELFVRQRANLQAELSVLTARKQALLGRAQALGAQLGALQQSISTSDQELAIKQPLLATRDVTIDEIQRLQRERSGQAAQLAQAQADRQQALAQASETDSQMLQRRTEFQEKASADLLEKQSELRARAEEFAAKQNVLERTVITAPQSGMVLNLAATTLGGVVRPAEPIMEIVPDSAQLVALVDISPTDRDAVVEGMAISAKILANKNWKTKPVDGRVLSVSADLLTDRESKRSFYQAEVALEAGKDATIDGIKVRPGMPVEVFVASGVRRTFLTYLFEPIIDLFGKGLGHA